MDRQQLLLKLVYKYAPDRLDPAYIAGCRADGIEPKKPEDVPTLVTFRDTDGYNSLRALTFGEIVDAVLEILE